MPLLTFLELEHTIKLNQILNHVNNLKNNQTISNSNSMSGNLNNSNGNNFATASSILAANNQLLKTASGIETILQLNQQQANQQMLINQNKLMLANKISELLSGNFNNGNAAAAAAVAASFLNQANINAQASSSNSKQINYSRYKTELCRQFTENGECKYSDKCQFAHGLNELKDVSRHPKYKTDLCKTFHSKGNIFLNVL